MIPRESPEYIKNLPKSKKWCEQNSNLLKYLSESLQMISPRTYARYRGAKSYLQSCMKLKPLCGIWFGAAINQQVTGSTSTHLDWGDHRHNCVIP
jgi:hypothetical protein